MPESSGASTSSEGRPDPYDFMESPGYEVGDLEDAYGLLEDSYWEDEDNENVILAGSTWNQVEEILEEGDDMEDPTDGEDRSWSSRFRDYMTQNDEVFVGGGLAGMGAGAVSSALGYGTAADLLVSGGALSITWGLASSAAKYFMDGYGSDKTVEEDGSVEDSELDEYSDWDVKVLDLNSYGEALQDYRQDSS